MKFLLLTIGLIGVLFSGGFSKVLKTLNIGIHEAVLIDLYNNAAGIKLYVSDKSKGYFVLDEENNVISNANCSAYSYVDEKGLFQFDYDKIKMIYPKDGKKYIFIDNRYFGPYDDVIESATGSDSKAFAFIYKQGGQTYIRVGENTLGPYEKAYRFEFAIKSPGDYIFTFTKNYQTYVQFNNKTYGPFENPYAKISPNGKTFAITWKNGSEFIGSYFQYGDKVYGPYKSTFFYQFSPDGTGVWFGYNAQKEDKYYFINGKTYGPFTYGTPGNVIFSKLNGKFGFMFHGDNMKYIQFNDQVLGPYYNCDYPAISYDGSGIVFKFFKLNKNNAEKYYYYNGKTEGPYDEIHCMGFSPDGSQVTALMYKKTDTFVRIGDKTFGPIIIDIIDNDNIVFSPDSKHFGFIYLKIPPKEKYLRTFFQIDDNSFGPYYLGSKLNISPLGKYFYCSITDNQESWSYFVDDAAVNIGKGSAIDIRFSPDKSRFAVKYYDNKNSFVYCDGISYGPFSMSWMDYGFTSDNRLIVAYYDVKSGKVLIEEKEGMEKNPVLTLSMKSEKKTAYEYLLLFTAKNTGNAPANNVTFNSVKMSGIFNIKCTDVPVFNLDPGETKTFQVNIAVDKKVLGKESSEYSFYIKDHGKNLSSTPQSLVITLE